MVFIEQYASVKMEGQNGRFETLWEALRSLLVSLEVVLRGPGILLETSWSLLDGLEGVRKEFWEPLGGVLGPSWHVLGASRRFLEGSCRLLVEFQSILDPFFRFLTGFWDPKSMKKCKRQIIGF